MNAFNSQQPVISRTDVLRVLHLLQQKDKYPPAQLAAILQAPEDVILRLVDLARMVLPEIGDLTQKKEYSSSEAARMVGVSKSTLYRILDELESDGAIRVERRQKGRISERIITNEAVEQAKARIG